MTAAPRTIGLSTPVTVRLANPHGVRRVSAWLEQSGARYPGLGTEQLRPRECSGSRHEAPRSITFEAGKNQAPNLKEGQARLVVEAVSNDLRGSTDHVRKRYGGGARRAARVSPTDSSITSTRPAWNW